MILICDVTIVLYVLFEDVPVFSAGTRFINSDKWLHAALGINIFSIMPRFEKCLEIYSPPPPSLLFLPLTSSSRLLLPHHAHAHTQTNVKNQFHLAPRTRTHTRTRKKQAKINAKEERGKMRHPCMHCEILLSFPWAGCNT